MLAPVNRSMVSKNAASPWSRWQSFAKDMILKPASVSTDNFSGLILLLDFPTCRSPLSEMGLAKFPKRISACLKIGFANSISTIDSGLGQSGRISPTP